MSADNWRICPNCVVKAKAGKLERLDEARQKYGVVPIEEWLKLNQEANHPIHLGHTLREDFQIGITENGLYFHHYQAHCEVCKFSFEHTSEFNVELPASSKPSSPTS